MEDIRVHIDGFDDLLDSYFGKINQIMKAIGGLDDAVYKLTVVKRRENVIRLKNDIRDRFTDVLLLVGPKFLTQDQITTFEIRSKGDIRLVIKCLISDISDYIKDMSEEFKQTNPELAPYMKAAKDALDYMISEIDSDEK